MTTDTPLTFPANFVWGAATSAYQIEGAHDADGKGPSIWDTFTQRRGKIADSTTGQIAANHYHRWPEDIGLMKALHLKAYRFSIAWSRVLPTGFGRVNDQGLDFYDRLVDALLENNITPHATLYHFDLPQALHEWGGWPRRDIAVVFADYARAVVARLGDRVTHWATFNEPFISVAQGYLTGKHAPGQRNPRAALRAVHHMLLAHGYAVQAIREAAPVPPQVGLVYNLSPVYPASDSEADRRAAIRIDGGVNRLFLDPVLKGAYPPDTRRQLRWFFPKIQPGDLDIIAEPLDYIGINYYSRMVVRHSRVVPLMQAKSVRPEASDYTANNLEIYPSGFYDILMQVWRDYLPSRIFITENGAAFPDVLTPDGCVHDEGRLRYFQTHLEQLHRAIAAGVPVAGYFAWSLLDNFEWAWGADKRFGLIHVDYDNNLTRTIKDSGQWYADVIKNNALVGLQAA